jgi:excinuclease UvrABC nuclease subunit
VSYIRPELQDRPHWVYRFADASGQVQYVGCTSKDPFRRLQALRSENPTTRHMEVRSVVADWFPNGIEAAIYEGRMIDFYDPPFNGARSAVALRRERNDPS